MYELILKNFQFNITVDVTGVSFIEHPVFLGFYRGVNYENLESNYFYILIQ